MITNHTEKNSKRRWYKGGAAFTNLIRPGWWRRRARGGDGAHGLPAQMPGEVAL